MPENKIYWHNGTWNAADNSGLPPRAQILVSGDWAPIRDFDPVITEDPEAIYGDLLPVMREADLNITNLEAPLSDTGEGVAKSGSVFKGMEHHARGLSAVPIDVATLANNHVFDFGLKAFENTRNILRQHGIAFTGAGMNHDEAESPLVREVKGVKIALINFCEGEDLTAAGTGPGVFGWEVDRACTLVRELRDQVNAVIVICHAGIEYIPFPPPYITDAFHRLAEAGADLVIGHHPHVPQGMEIYKGVPLCYSLGNFVFFQNTHLHYRKIGYMVEAGIGIKGISSIRLIPYEIGSRSLSLLKGPKHDEFFHDMKRISTPLKSEEGITGAWHGFLKYYGLEGFKAEIGRIMEKVDSDLPTGAAMFRNRITTMQHSAHLTDLMTRLVQGTIDDAPDWAVEINRLWFSRTIENSSIGGV